MNATLLVELLTEELPPKALATLGQTFAEGVLEGLKAAQLVAPEALAKRFSTPRRLAVQIAAVRDRAEEIEREVQGPSVKVGLDAAGKPTPALTGFAKKNGIGIDAMERRDTAKGEVFVARVKAGGARLDALLSEIVDKALKRLPVPKLMRWGEGEAQFVRPAHGLVMLHGERVVPGNVLGLEAGNRTRGHRFMGKGEIVLARAEDYEARLRDDGRVIADSAARRAEIERQLKSHATRLEASLGEDIAALLDEVTALVEHPSVYVGAFDANFLEVPQECLTLTMRQNQKYFPLFDAEGKLLARFLIVSNVRVDDPRSIVEGNQRVVRPRLEDARFFLDQDRRERLEARVPRLAKVVYHNKLGSQLERVERLQQLAGSIARQIGADPLLAERAAWLAKADLLTGMVGEFPELQGVMGRYYALHDGEPRAVADAIEAHYRPRFAGDRLPEAPAACALALADRLDAIVGLFAVGGAPTGDKDPFALRRQSLGALRILIDRRLALPLKALLAEAAALFPADRIAAGVPEETFAFMLDRLRGYLREAGYAADEIDSVASQLPERIDLVPARLDAVKGFRILPEAESLAAANKRIRNILKKAGERGGAADPALLADPAEKALFESMTRLTPEVETRIEREDYAGALKALAGVRTNVDRFFDDVMVNVEDARLRGNRIALLRQLDALMNRVADISRLVA